MAVAFGILGPLEATRDAEPVDLGAAKQRALLAILLIHANQVVPIDRLIDDLWGASPPPTAGSALQVYVSALRKALEPDRPARAPATVLVTQAPGYLIRVGVQQLDLLQFETLVGQGRAALGAGGAADAARLFSDALALWRGPALAEFAYESFAEREAARLEELRLSATEDRLEAELALGHHGAAVGELEALAAAEPLRERVSAQLILALYRCGRQAEALRVYERLRRALAEELGIEPSPEVRQLESGVLQQSPELSWSPRERVDAAGRHVQSESASADESADARPPLPPTLAGKERGAFVGRQPELETLRQALESATSGEPQVVFLAGEPGIGKTRLASELAREAHAKGAVVLLGRCDQDLAMPYGPFVEALSSYVESASPTLLQRIVGPPTADLRRLIPQLAPFLEDVPDRAKADALTERYRLFEAAAAFIAAAGQQTPVVVVVEDLHWADKPTLLLLKHLVRRSDAACGLIVATYRDTELVRGEPLAEMLADLRRDQDVGWLNLQKLDLPEVEALITEALPDLDPGRTRELARALNEKTEGNPFFLREVLRSLREAGALGDGEAGVARRESEQPSVPEAVQDVITQRLARLSERANVALSTACVVGSTFDLTVIEAMSESSDSLLDALEEAAEAHVISEVSGVPGRYAFSHVLIRDVLDSQLSSARRARLHHQAARAVEALVPADDIDSHLAELAYHYTAAAGSDLLRAVDFGQRAAERANEQLAYEEAVAHFERALAAAEVARADELTLCDLLLGLGDARWRAGEGEASRRAFVSAAEIARDTGDADRLAQAAVGAAGVGFEGRVDEEVLRLLEDSLSVLGSTVSRSRVQAMVAYSRALWAHDPDCMRAISADAVAVARELGDVRGLVAALGSRVFSLLGQPTTECSSVARELIELAASAGDAPAEMEARIFHLVTLMEHADTPNLTDELQAVHRLADELRQPLYNWYALAWDATLAVLQGRFDEAQQLADQALNVGYPVRGPDAMAAYFLHVVLIRWAQERLSEVLPPIDSYLEQYPEIPGWWAVRAWVLAELGRVQDATADIERLAADDFDRLGRDVTRAAGLAFASQACATLELTGHAPRLYELLLPHADCHVVTSAWLAGGVSWGPTPYYLGQLSALIGDAEQAFRHFEEALRLSSAVGARPWLGWTNARYGQAILRLGGPTDGSRAAAMLDAASAVAREVGMPRLERTVSATREASR